ncbi:MAG: xanthine dehydrogenase family protein subunit M [Betaproteobacteria bacterium]|nr:xanthine dehydrogenase family protein subunit M [Betaproteobacteria bacterium]
MKPTPFDYASPATLAEAVSLLSARDANAMPIAGGQSLMPVLAFRLAAPKLLVDLRRIPGLNRIETNSEGVHLGAMVRWRDIEDDARLDNAHPLLKAAIEHVAHYQIRNRGTIGGSLAHADPAAELPGIAVTCDGIINAAGPNGARTIRAAEFFLGPLSTALKTGEIITGLQLSPWSVARRWGFEEISRRRGDFAITAIGLFYDTDAAGRAANTHIGVIGACRRPHRIAEAEAALNGCAVNDASILAAAKVAATAVDPPEDLHAPARYRRALVETLVERALRQAAARSTRGNT